MPTRPIKIVLYTSISTIACPVVLNSVIVSSVCVCVGGGGGGGGGNSSKYTGCVSVCHPKRVIR